MGRFGPGLLLICVALGAVVFYQWNAPPSIGLPTDAEARSIAAIEPLPEVQEFKAPLIDDYQEMIERPLFMQTRKPPVPAPDVVPDVPAPAGPQGNFILVGTIITEKSRSALVQQEGQTETLGIKLGETINGWTLESVEADHIILKIGETTLRVDIRKDLPPIAEKPKRRDRRARNEERRRRAEERRERRRAAEENDEAEAGGEADE